MTAARRTVGQETVLRLLGGTADDYDRVVARSTGGLDQRWKRWMLERMDEPREVLDLASGTGILSFLILERFPACRLTGVDLQADYQAVARARADLRGFADRTTWVHAPVEEAELPEARYDVIASCYLPKYADRPVLAERLWRWAAPGAQVLLHDFTHPSDARIERYLKKQYDLWLARVRRDHPHWVDCFRDLYDVVKASPWAQDTGPLLEAQGFEDVQVHALTNGLAAVVEARKPG